jgi:uncharacterized protein YbgA (DUF1722 family)
MQFPYRYVAKPSANFLKIFFWLKYHFLASNSLNTKNSDVLLTNSQISEFVLKGFSEIKSDLDIAALVHFHSINKFLLMAHNHAHTTILGNIVANHDLFPASVVFEKYEHHLASVLKFEPSIKSHVNVLQKILGYFKKELTKEEKATILEMLSGYRKETETLNDILLSLEELTRKFQKTYLVRQTYFLLYVRVSKSG